MEFMVLSHMPVNPSQRAVVTEVENHGVDLGA